MEYIYQEDMDKTTHCCHAISKTLFMIRLFHPSHPPITLTPYANLLILLAFPTALASDLALHFSAPMLL